MPVEQPVMRTDDMGAKCIRYHFPMLSRALRVFLPLALLAAFVFWVCAFRIFDADFFWHVTAGTLMRTTGGLITVDPFSWTREGLPYLANHEWLAQIILSFVLDLFGSTGVIILRSLLVTLALALPVLTGWKRAWAYVPLAMLAALVIKGGAMDRPHLWTWMMVSAFLYISSTVLLRAVPGAPRSRDMKWPFIALLALQILWVNLHGGAALLGVIIGGAWVLQLLFDRWHAGALMLNRETLMIVGFPIALILVLMVSPLGWENLSYVQTLLTDTTTRFIAEWQPRAWALYLQDLWPFWIAAMGSVVLIRKQLVFSILLLIIFGFLSRQAYRHEMVFVLVALGITVLQLEHSERWKERMERVCSVIWRPMAISGMVMLALVLHGRSVNNTFANRYDAHGYGLNDRAADVVAFLERERVDGKAFNTYGLGFELLAHGRRVFVDGRNVDYGEEFLSALFTAADDPSAFRSLETKHGFTVALIDLSDAKEGRPIPYLIPLSQDPSWVLVYLDDAVAAYVKDDAAHKDLIARERLKILTPENVTSGKVLSSVTDLGPVIAELKRAAAGAPHAFQARVLLGRALVAQGNLTDASAVAEEAVALRPDDYRGYEVFGLLYARAGEYDRADFAFGEAISRLSAKEAEPLRAYVARIFEGVGQEERAKKYR